MTPTAEHVGIGPISVAYTESGAGAPVVLLHGGESNRHQFDLFRPLLGPGIRAIAYDQRDVGGTTGGPEPYTIATLAADCAGLIEALDAEPAHVVGASLGGAIAMHVALDHPDRVASLTLISAPPSVPATTGGTAAKILAMSPAERTAFMLDAVLSPEGRRRDPELETRVRSLLTASAGLGPRRRAAIRTHDCTDRLAGITAPTLVLNGTNDPLVPVSTAELLAERIPGAVLELIDGGRHGLTLEQRDVTAALVRRFVLDHGSRAGGGPG
jgi:3-oxoadipate enol-lactonase